MSRYIDTDAVMKICILIMLICIIISNYYFKKIDKPNQKEKVMNRWIDADALAHIIASNGDADFINKVTKLMIDAPSIDIVRCGECKHTYMWDSGCGAELVCKARRCDPSDWGNDHIEFYVKADDFCSYGERRANES